MFQIICLKISKVYFNREDEKRIYLKDKWESYFIQLQIVL